MLSFKLYFERVVGLIETIQFKELGPVDAKVDSGNGAYNVLHGENLQINGNTVTFQTVNNKTLTKPIVEYIDINIGSGNVEQRPVVLFDIQMAGENYPKTPFSLANRATNDEKVLIGKDFIIKLGGLIDVRQTHAVS